MTLNRFLYESSISHRGYIIIPFRTGTIKEQELDSDKFLCELGNRGRFHQFENPAELYSSVIEKLIGIAQEYLDQFSDLLSPVNYFQARSIYQDELITIDCEALKDFHNHYQPDSLTNIAAPKTISSQHKCTTWVS